MSSPGGMSLEEAINRGQGVERPFRCPKHDDHLASASVNVLKGVWFCHACHEKGVVTGKAVPKIDDLIAMMRPERAARHYPDTYLELFVWPGEKYWDTRLAPWVTYQLGMGQDPLTGDATFPVHTPNGTLAGVGRRHVEADKAKRYLYPRHWSASQSLFGLGGTWRRIDVLALVEGAADAAAVWEVGCPALAVYGSGLHLPQVELLLRTQPRLVLLGFDMDDAGEEATSRAFKQLGRHTAMKRVYWPSKDPGECTPAQRRAALTDAVARSDYGETVVTPWRNNVARSEAAYERFLKDTT